MTTTPKLSTVIRSRIERADRGKQTAFPAKVLSYTASSNVVALEPQFVETWFTRDYDRVREEGNANITDVPVCFPRHMSWTIDVGDFGLVICTKYSLNQWRIGRTRDDPGDLRRFTMAGATFHPVLMDETPPTQQFVALANLVKSELDKIQTTFESIVVGTGGGGEVVTPYTASSVASTTVKVTE